MFPCFSNDDASLLPFTVDVHVTIKIWELSANNSKAKVDG